MKEICAFLRRITCRYALESVVKNPIGDARLVSRKVAFEQASIRPEVLDAMMHPRRYDIGDLFGTDRRFALPPIDADVAREVCSDAAQLHDRVGAFAQLDHIAAPFFVDLDQGFVFNQFSTWT